MTSWRPRRRRTSITSVTSASVGVHTAWPGSKNRRAQRRQRFRDARGHPRHVRLEAGVELRRRPSAADVERHDPPAGGALERDGAAQHVVGNVTPGRALEIFVPSVERHGERTGLRAGGDRRVQLRLVVERDAEARRQHRGAQANAGDVGDPALVIAHERFDAVGEDEAQRFVGRRLQQRFRPVVDRAPRREAVAVRPCDLFVRDRLREKPGLARERNQFRARVRLEAIARHELQAARCSARRGRATRTRSARARPPGERCAAGSRAARSRQAHRRRPRSRRDPQAPIAFPPAGLSGLRGDPPGCELRDDVRDQRARRQPARFGARVDPVLADALEPP